MRLNPLVFQKSLKKYVAHKLLRLDVSKAKLEATALSPFMGQVRQEAAVRYRKVYCRAKTDRNRRSLSLSDNVSTAAN